MTSMLIATVDNAPVFRYAEGTITRMEIEQTEDGMRITVYGLDGEGSIYISPLTLCKIIYGMQAVIPYLMEEPTDG